MVLGRLLTQKRTQKLVEQDWLVQKGAVFLFTIIILNFDGLLMSANMPEAHS